MPLLKQFLKPGLHNRIALYSLLLFVIQIVCVASFSIYYLQKNLEQEIGRKALAVSRALSTSEIIRLGLVINDSKMVQAYVEKIRQLVDAKFIVVGNTDGIRLSHPDISKIGKKMVGGDNGDALTKGLSYVSTATGSLGVSVRGKSPVLSKHNNIIGLVSVGYLKKDITESVGNLKTKFIIIFGVLLLAGIFQTTYIARRYRNEIFGLEPEEIARTYSERQAVLESILEAIVVADAQGQITGANPVAEKILGIEEEVLLTMNLSDIFPGYDFLFNDNSQPSWRDMEITANKQPLLMNKTQLLINKTDNGVVLSFQLKDDLITLSKKLSQVEQFSTMLNVQSHEYSNKLNTIGGLIQIGSIDEALELISSESSGYQELIEFLLRTIPDPIIAGLILGKYNVAKEKNITFIIDDDSSLDEIPSHLPREKLVTILGNLIDNAFDASIKADNEQAVVSLAITHAGNDIIFEIEDNGGGISEKNLAHIFSLGSTSKSELGHGIGMYLVKNALDYVGGYLSVTECQPSGTLMTVYIPKIPPPLAE